MNYPEPGEMVGAADPVTGGGRAAQGRSVDRRVGGQAARRGHRRRGRCVVAVTVNGSGESAVVATGVHPFSANRRHRFAIWLPYLQ